VSGESERDFGSWVEDLLTLRSWLWQHQRPAQTAKGWRTAISGTAGLPDIVAVRLNPGCDPDESDSYSLLFIELKSERGKVRPDQELWIDLLGTCAEVYVWRPSDRPEIERVLA
jgi:VRR-NUC domain